VKFLHLHHEPTRVHECGDPRVWIQARRLAQLGHQTTFVEVHGERQIGRVRWERVSEPGIARIRSDRRPRRALFPKDDIALLVEGGLTCDFELVLVASTNITLVTAGLRLARERGVPFVLEQATPWPKNQDQALRDEAYAEGRRIIVANQELVDDLLSLGISSRKIALIEPSVEDSILVRPADGTPAPVSLRQRSSLLRHRPLVAVLADLDSAQVRESLLALASHIRTIDPPVLLAVLGHGAGYEDLRQRVQTHPNTALVCEPMPTAAARVELLQAADLALSAVPDTSFDPPLEPLLDALACGNPVIYNHYGAFGTSLVAQNVGFAYDLGDPEDTAQLLIRTLRQPDWRRFGPPAARSFAGAARFDPIRHAHELDHLLRSCIEADPALPEFPILHDGDHEAAANDPGEAPEAAVRPTGT